MQSEVFNCDCLPEMKNIRMGGLIWLVLTRLMARKELGERVESWANKIDVGKRIKEWDFKRKVNFLMNYLG